MVQLHHLPETLGPDPERILMRPFHIATEPREGSNGISRARRVVNGVRDMGPDAAAVELERVCREFAHRHDDITRYFRHRWREMDDALNLDDASFTPQQRDLIGAYFSHEYSYASAALMNPSVVEHPQPGANGANAESGRFVMSLRTVGEGHISAVAFREGTFRTDGTMSLDPLPDVSFSPEVSAHAVGEPDERVDLVFDHDTPLSGTVIFPVTPMQRNGLEDLRLVRFQDGGEEPVYYGSYTAYSGRAIRSELLETRDFLDFTMRPMTGSAAVNKGMAIFPRRVNGRYAVIGRQDSESLFFITSDSITHWEGGQKIAAPLYPWELIQIGNCGAPIEIDEGWLLLTHGVGAVRKYAIGAMLLDRDDPSRVIARSRHPILAPQDERREGYVPNVVYTCGGLAVGRRLFLPHGVADQSVAFCWLDLDELMTDMT